ncbi:hypothetical protein BBBOND_0207920 [Babesia bigemina]|uniref:Uncharacterized protein n=1 Tax=Babesia bigemina TaxID=5866 RepID=A0A061D4Z4_BABBI|nr:hypothetical protein BBBOND_0207920 [Babesia bigemina]CDR95638.1 hypothetical protein BBBOND_0207920 [Babesia bigemina]|eukprot:XP_012767824.1 hypothetical protein BBBOND_0207920 [Babesia bigemina]
MRFLTRCINRLELVMNNGEDTRKSVVKLNSKSDNVQLQGIGAAFNEMRLWQHIGLDNRRILWSNQSPEFR